MYPLSTALNRFLNAMIYDYIQIYFKIILYYCAPGKLNI